MANDIIIKESAFSVDETIENIRNIIIKKGQSEKGLAVFTVIDHKANAANVNMQLNESKLIIFGNPRVGTLLMQEDMTIALDLPLRILVYADDNNNTKVAYRDGSWIKSHHFLQEDNLVKKVDKVMDKITDKACTK
jgi:uncharacterized protein (DUF302 family)